MSFSKNTENLSTLTQTNEHEHTYFSKGNLKLLLVIKLVLTTFSDSLITLIELQDVSLFQKPCNFHCDFNSNPSYNFNLISI